MILSILEAQKNFMFAHKKSNKNINLIEKMLKKELPNEDLSKLHWDSVENENIEYIDPRSWFRKFVESTAFHRETARYSTTINLINGKAVIFSMQIGKAKSAPRPICTGIDFQIDTQMQLKGEVVYTVENRSLSPDIIKEQIAYNKDILKRLKRLIIPIRIAMPTEERPEGFFTITPNNSGSTVKVSTIPQEINGGFSYKTGISDILSIVDAFDKQEVN